MAGMALPFLGDASAMNFAACADNGVNRRVAEQVELAERLRVIGVEGANAS